MADLDDIVKRGYEKQEEVGKGTFGVVYKGIRLSGSPFLTAHRFVTQRRRIESCT